jgi:hypothetical protein
LELQKKYKILGHALRGIAHNVLSFKENKNPVTIKKKSNCFQKNFKVPTFARILETGLFKK